MRYSFKMKKGRKRKKKKDKTFDTKEKMIIFWLCVVAIVLYVSWLCVVAIALAFSYLTKGYFS